MLCPYYQATPECCCRFAIKLTTMLALCLQHPRVFIIHAWSGDFFELITQLKR
jgi:hypothetical protein